MAKTDLPKIVRPYRQIIQDLLFNKHRLRDWREWVERDSSAVERIKLLEQEKEALIEELLYENAEADFEKLCLSCKERLTEAEIVRLHQLNEPHP